MDKRRRQYAAVDVWFAFSDTFDRLHETFGPPGPLAFILLIAAAKRAPIQGELSYVSPESFWGEIGYPDDGTRPDLDQFLTLLGRLKQTSRRASGRRLDVLLTNFEQWQDLPQRFKAAERSSRKRAQNTRDKTRTKPAPNANDTSTETRRDEPTGSFTSQGVGADATPDAAPADAGGAGSRNGQYAEALTYIHSPAAPPDPDELALALLDRWPDLPDHDIQELVLAAADDEPPS